MFLQVLLHDLQHGPTGLCHGSTGKEKQHPISSTTPSYFLDLFLYLSFFLAVGKEAGRRWEVMWEDEACGGAATSFIAPWCNNQGGEAAGLHKLYKKVQ
jgi:hypothetical protein